MDEATKLLEKLLFLCDPWKVQSVSHQVGGVDRSVGRVTIELAIERGQLVPYPKCGEMCKRHNEKMREWWDLNLLKSRTVLRASVPRANCPKHGIHQINVPWAEPRTRQTMRPETAVIDDLLEISMDAVARKWDLSRRRVNGIQERAVERRLQRRSLQHPQRIGIDETSFQRSHEYVILVVDQGQKGSRHGGYVLYVADGKDTAAIKPFFKDLGEVVYAQIKTVAMDMVPAYISATTKHTAAAICINHFYVAHLLNKAVDDVRRSENKALLQQGDTRLKNTRYDWLMSEKRMSPARQKRLAALRKHDLKVDRAWILKDQANELWKVRDKKLVRLAWQAWCMCAIRPRLTPMVKVAKTIWRYLRKSSMLPSRAPAMSCQSPSTPKCNGSNGRLAANETASDSEKPSTSTWVNCASTRGDDLHEVLKHLKLIALEPSLANNLIRIEDISYVY